MLLDTITVLFLIFAAFAAKHDHAARRVRGINATHFADGSPLLPAIPQSGEDPEEREIQNEIMLQGGPGCTWVRR